MRRRSSGVITQDSEIRFEFWAVRRITRQRFAASISIGLPILVDGHTSDYRCSISIGGFLEWSHISLGASPFQALDIAMGIVKMEMRHLTEDWNFYFDEEGHINFL